MKRILAFFSALAFLGINTISVSACGVSKGHEVEINIKNPPKEAKEGEDPLNEYVYNDKYYYNNNNVIYLLALSAQLVVQKIYDDNQKSFNDEVWKEFYSSQEWQRGYFSSFNFDQTDALPSGEKDFSYVANNNEDLIFHLKNNDASKDNNKLRSYWFVTSEKPWSKGSKDYKPTRNHITVPKAWDFKDEKEEITQTGWLHFYLEIDQFRIDFSAEINFNFIKVKDINEQWHVLLNTNTFAQPFGVIDFSHPDRIYEKVIANISISKKTDKI